MHLKQLARDGLLKPLQAVSGIVERRHTLPILSNVLVEQSGGKLSVTATDLEIQISAQSDVAIPEGDPTAVTLPARKLQDLLRALPEESLLNIDAQAAKVVIRAGKSRFNLQSMPAADYPRITPGQDKQQTVQVPQRQLRALFGLVSFAMAQQDIRYYLNGLLLVIDKNSMLAVATDGHRLSYASLALETEYAHQEVILPRKTVLELTKLLADDDALVTIDILTNQIRFRFSNIELVSKVIDGKFPDYNRVIPTGYARSITLERTVILHTLQRAAILSNEKFRGVRLVLSPGSLKIICTNSEQEEAEEELEIAYAGDPIDVGFNINYLLDVLMNLGAPEVVLSFGDANSSALITMPERTDYKYVVMPMRI
ncbi:MAG: DNA polymerase III subunit beta [Betaproteobacteria bacterium]